VLKEIQYLNPAESTLKLNFKIIKEGIQLAKDTLNKKGKYEIWHTVKGEIRKGAVCARVKMQVYLRDDKEKKKLGF
jgi:hypothetical protein